MDIRSFNSTVGELFVATAADDYMDGEQVEFMPEEPASKWSLVVVWLVIFGGVASFVWGVLGR